MDDRLIIEGGEDTALGIDRVVCGWCPVFVVGVRTNHNIHRLITY